MAVEILQNTGVFHAPVSRAVVMAIAVPLLGFVFAAPAAVAQGRLGQIRESVNATPPAEPSRRSERKRDVCRHGIDPAFCTICEERESLIDQFFAGFVSGLFRSGKANSKELRPTDAQAAEQRASLANYETIIGTRPSYFAHYPYADGFDGYFMEETNVQARPLTGAVRFRTYYSTDFDDIVNWHVDGFMEWNKGWAIDAEVNYLLETLPSGFEDNLTLGDVNFLRRIWASQESLVRIGLGMNWLEDRGALDLGINGTILWDWFPTKPLTISHQFDLGKIGSATSLHLESTVGVCWEHLELFGGFNYRRIGDVDLAGPMVGIRGWW